jgi:hypothetical protein
MIFFKEFLEFLKVYKVRSILIFSSLPGPLDLPTTEIPIKMLFQTKLKIDT